MNYAPQLTAIPNQTVYRGEAFATTPLGNYVEGETADEDLE